MSKRKGYISATELMAQLQADPEWVARHRARRERTRKLVARLRREQKPLLKELARVGYRLESVYDLVNTADSYPEAVPVLLKHFRNYDYDESIREGIARALTVKEAKYAISELLEAFRVDPDTSLNGPKGALGNAISALADKRHVDEIISLTLDRSHGKGRWALAEWLCRRKGDKITEALEQLVSDPDVEISLRAKEALERRRGK